MNPSTEIVIGSTVSPSFSGVETEAKEEGGIESTAVDYSTNSDDEAFNIMKDALTGTYVTKNGYNFCFGANGYFSGFFDDSNTKMEGGKYEIKEQNDKMIIRIINTDGSRMVEYNLLMNGPKGFFLIYEPSGYTMKLEKKDG